MRDPSPILILSSLLLGAAVANEQHHDHSLKHVQKRHDIPLEFIMNSQEHSDIRRSVRMEKGNVQRLSSDKFVVRRQDPSTPSDSSSEVSGEPASIPDKFDQPSYDFMLPEGKFENSTILAVVDFITRKHNIQPQFVVNFDENQWFDIGKVEKTTADNADVYKATVILRAGVDVDISKTESGLYKFVVEAQQGGEVVLATTNISVDVLRLAPTTKRVRVTVPAGPKVMGATTISSMDYEELASTESLTLGGGAKEKEDPFNSDDDDLTTTVATEATLTTTTVEPEPLSTVSQKETSENNEEESEESEEEVEVPESEGSGETVDFPTFGTKAPNAPSEQLEGSGSPSSTPSEPSDDDLATDASGEQLLSPSDPSPSDSEDSGNPIDGPITILPLLANQDGQLEALDAHLELVGSERSLISIPTTSRSGDVIRNIHVALRSLNLTKSTEVELKIVPEGILSIRPRKLRVDEEAGLFIEKMEENEMRLEIIGSVPGAETPLKLPIRIQRSLESSQELLGSEMLSLRTVEFAIPESAESGRTLGSIEGEMMIMGSHGMFSLIGNDIILTCSQFSSDKCLEGNDRKTFTMILMPKNGTLAPLEVTVRVQQQANLRTSDEVIRISDNRIISPFAVITERTLKTIKLDGDAAKFLGFVKAQEGLYQIIVVNSAPSGRYDLSISLQDLDNSPTKSISVFVENSLSHAHFRKPKYDVEIDGDKVKLDVKLTQVELEGVPIDEAKIMILDGNPGWVTVESYGGRVKVGKFDGPIYTGKYPIRIGAVDKKTWTILTETLLQLTVNNGEERLPEVPQRSSMLVEKTFDREKTENFRVELPDSSRSLGLRLDPKSVFGIDENGQRVPVSPTSITLSENILKLQAPPLKSLRLLSITMTSESSEQKLTILIRLISSPEYLENVRKNAERPVFPDPWTREDNLIHVEMREELAPGQVVGVFPAVTSKGISKGTSESSETEINLEGEMKDAFDFDSKTGELKVKQRIDYESLSEEQKEFDLKLTTGEKGYESVAVLKVKVLDVDDNSPVIDTGDVEVITLPENLPPNTKIAEFQVTDPDGSDNYTVKLSDGFKASIQNGTLEIFTSESSHLDYELQDAQTLLVEVSDVSNNSDRVLIPIKIQNVNDNAPEFSKKLYDIEAIEDWPRGVVLEKIIAEDKDEKSSSSALSQTSYSIHGPNTVIGINSTTGIVFVNDELWGLARDAPYRFEIVAEDSGEPEKLNSTAILSLRVRGKGDVMTEEQIVFLEHNNEVMVKENLPLDTKIYTSNAELRGLRAHGTLTYSLKDLISDDKEEHFAIDKKSGDIFVVNNLDFEKRNEYTVLQEPEPSMSHPN